MRTLCFFLACMILPAQITVSLRQGPDSIKGSVWYEATVCNHHEGSITVMGSTVTATSGRMLDLVPATPEYKPPTPEKPNLLGIPIPGTHPKPAPARTVIGPDLNIHLQRGDTCMDGWLLGKSKISFVPVTLIVAPPYLPPVRTQRRDVQQADR